MKTEAKTESDDLEDFLQVIGDGGYCGRVLILLFSFCLAYCLD
jgi:hypothetical protein